MLNKPRCNFFQILGYFSGTFLENTFCDTLAVDFRPKGEFAIARRGQCNFLQKTQVAQLAGFKGEPHFLTRRVSTVKFDQILGRTLWSCGLMHHVLDWQVGGSNPDRDAISFG